ncbi:MAG: serine/threonine-protein kinase PknK, partial [Nitrospina sp.]|nr:serine/threonine-protein kinase PknK [Nitrospina sp.]
MSLTSSNKQPFDSISGCAVTEKIYESPHTVVYRSRRERDDLPVILKILRSEYPTPQERLGFREEYEMTRRLSIEGVIGVYGLEKHHNSFAMLLEDFDAASLDLLMQEREFPIEEFLSIAIMAVSILGRIHAANVIHKRINPSNILYNPETQRVKIIDFGSATALSHENPPMINPQALESVQYISPEQTGRMNRHLDYRTDFYSLGVAFYEMLTGQLPFSARDAMDLVHCHLAKEAMPPCSVNPEIPELLSNMVMKLMAKTPEDRYQSTLGIQSDLEKFSHQLGQTPGIIDPFPLASHDISDKFRIPRKLYGRNREVDLLTAAFERVNRGACELMFVTGPVGIGKTALVHEILERITQNRGYFISGKFDQYQRNVPYFAVITAFQDLVRQLLTENEAGVTHWREKLLAALTPNVGVIIEVIPEVELITGPQQKAPELPPAEAKNRFDLVFRDFITVFAGRTHPLVIFLDDLQWVDAPSLHVLKRLATFPKSRNLLVIGAYRDNEATHALRTALEDIRKEGAVIDNMTLSPLASHEIMQLIAETLKCDPETVRPLAQLVLTKTAGNPFFVNVFLKSLHEENYISFDHLKRRWQWSMKQIQEERITDNVVELMAGKIHRLHPDTKNALMSAACLGNQFELETVAMALEKTPEDTMDSLKEAVAEGLVIETHALRGKPSVMKGEGSFPPLQCRYKFSHDRIQQAAYTLISAGEKGALHRKIGQLLLDKIPMEERDGKLFDIVGNLNKGIECVCDQTERDALAHLNLQTGNKVKSTAAFESAHHYFKI